MWLFTDTYTHTYILMHLCYVRTMLSSTCSVRGITWRIIHPQFAFDSVSNTLRMRCHRNVRIIKVLYIISGIVNYGIELIALEWHMSA